MDDSARKPDLAIQNHDSCVVVYMTELIGSSSGRGAKATSSVESVSSAPGAARTLNEELATPHRLLIKPKTQADFLEDMVLRYSHKPLPSKDLPAAEYQKAIDAILNDPTVKHRFIFSTWPRPPPIPNWRDADLQSLKPSERPYEFIKPENSVQGKMTPNGVQLWGETLFDFHMVQRIPGLENLATITSGSKMLGWCKKHGEYEGEKAVAKECIEWAEREKEPEVVPVWSQAASILEREQRIISDWRKKQEEKMQVEGESNAVQEVEQREGSASSAFKTGVEACPLPWEDVEPFVKETGPFNYRYVPDLEDYIPQHRLPQKLIVHDPWNLLHVDAVKKSYVSDTEDSEEMKVDEKDIPWADKVKANPDYKHVYRLEPSSMTSERWKADADEAVRQETRLKEILGGFLENPHSSAKNLPPGFEHFTTEVLEAGPIKPPVYVVLPPQPPLPPAEEAHLYLSPAHSVGVGHHSFVYKAEWEVPRSFLVKDELCKQCIMDDLLEQIKEEDGENGERRDAKWDERVGEMVWKEEIKPALTMCVDNSTHFEDEVYLLDEGYARRRLVYQGPYRVVQSRVKYQNLARAPYCKHLQEKCEAEGVPGTHPHPLTAKVSVAAKLSIQHDTHLAREASNYQKFPKHFFQHWSGYNILPPIHDPTPLGPLVPQYYGYYVPEEAEEKREQEKEEGKVTEEREKQYLSPILLLEMCGSQIRDKHLSVDDRQESIALVLRFHEAMWVHNSLYQRNILKKPGPLRSSPKERHENMAKRGGYGIDWSFRLIDFGRSEYVGDTPGTDIIGSLDSEHQELKSWFGGYRPLE